MASSFFVVVGNDLLNGVTTVKRAAVVSVDGGATVNHAVGDRREYVEMLSDASLGCLVVPFSLGWPNRQVKKTVTKAAVTCNTTVSSKEASATTSFDTKKD